MIAASLNFFFNQLSFETASVVSLKVVLSGLLCFCVFPCVSFCKELGSFLEQIYHLAFVFPISGFFLISQGFNIHHYTRK